ncbi:polysaccharide pyruvyl transferase family protein [Clostridium perfringens]
MKKFLRNIIGESIYKHLSRKKEIYMFNKRIKKFRKIKGKKCILLDVPSYGNIGDQAITLGEFEFIKDKYNEYEFMYFTVGDLNLNLEKNLSLIKKYTSKDDIIFLQGGGHFGDLYIESELKRREIIKLFNENKIILMPSSMTFTNDTNKELSKYIYSKHKNLNLILRDRKSYNDAKETFNKNNILLMPDIVFYMCGTDFHKKFLTYEKSGIGICFRNDKENIYNIESKNNFLDRMKLNFKEIDIFDTNVNYGIREEKRALCVEEMISKFSCRNLVITDRFHGMIFSILSETPCIVLKSLDHKIVEGMKWVDDYNVVNLASSFNELDDFIYNTKIQNGNYKQLFSDIKNEFYKI